MNHIVYKVRHTTRAEYPAPVFGGHHLAALQPRELPWQKLLSHELRVTPTTTPPDRHTDYFGNQRAFISVLAPHDHLEITSLSRVARSLPYTPSPSETAPWESARLRVVTDRATQGLEAIEFAFESPFVETSPELEAYGLQSFAPNRPILESAIDLNNRIFEDFTFDPEATTVSTPVAEVFENRRGVCQDFAHFQIACLRSLGLAARYVSGYLETDPPPGGTKLVGSDASHAWIALYCPSIGWVDLDPTNGCIPSMRHITVGWGRDYSDVPPVRGVITGGSDQKLSVEVDVLPQAPHSGE